MGNNYWIKLYHEMLLDPKVGRLSDGAFRLMVNCFLLAGEAGENGLLPTTADMAWRLHLEETALLAQLEELAGVEIVVVREDGRWWVRKFAVRQGPISDAEKQRDYRDRKRHAEAAGYGFGAAAVTEDVTVGDGVRDEADTSDNGSSYAGVTNGNAEEESESESDADTDENQKKKKNGASSSGPAMGLSTKLSTELSTGGAELLATLYALTGFDGREHPPGEELCQYLGQMAEKGVLAVDIQAAWDWYEGQHGRPKNLDVLKKPILRARNVRLKEAGSGEFDGFVQK